MRFSSVLASSLICVSAISADFETSKDNVVVLDKVTVSSKIEKNILNEPTKVEVAGKETILESPDLAKSLLNVSGFSMTRKGGGGSEILYRSQGAGRLLIFIDNSLLQGGCGGRMDTAITYISPENYRSVRIIKGPQDVRFGALISGAVLFDRDILRLSQTTFS
ncbi:MAG: TonB-dependent receptor plug domain-containing protein [Campylobacter hyointestinalis]